MLDSTLLRKFSSAVEVLQPGTPTNVTERVHGILVEKMYNATSNNFLQGISKLNCLQEKKAVDANIGLRDKLKSYAVEKQSTF